MHLLSRGLTLALTLTLALAPASNLARNLTCCLRLSARINSILFCSYTARVSCSHDACMYGGVYDKCIVYVSARVSCSHDDTWGGVWGMHVSARVSSSHGGR